MERLFCASNIQNTKLQRNIQNIQSCNETAINKCTLSNAMSLAFRLFTRILLQELKINQITAKISEQCLPQLLNVVSETRHSQSLSKDKQHNIVIAE